MDLVYVEGIFILLGIWIIVIELRYVRQMIGTERKSRQSLEDEFDKLFTRVGQLELDMKKKDKDGS